MQRILIDYLTLSVSRSIFDVSAVCAAVGISQDDMTDIKPYNGFHHCLYYGGIKILYHDIVEDIKRPLVSLDMSGQGCRLLESIKEGTSFDWIDFIESFLKEEGSHLARLDIACDDKVEEEGETPLLSFPTMVKHVKQRRYICQANRKIWTDGDEQQILFGAPSSDRRLRIYNKQLERGYDKHWIRAEFQLRNQAALSFYMRALELSGIGATYYGLLYGYLRFTREVNAGDDHQSRLTVCRWWQKFCNGAEKLKGFYLGGCEYNMQRLENYLRQQAASSIETYMQIKSGDIGRFFGLVEGAKLNKRQEWLIKVMELQGEIDRTYNNVTHNELPASVPGVAECVTDDFEIIYDYPFSDVTQIGGAAAGSGVPLCVTKKE